MNHIQNRTAPILVWWILWVATFSGLGAFYVFLSPSEASQTMGGCRFLPMAPFLAAVLLRWLILPRVRQRARAFPVFVIGVALSESCALMGLFLVPDQKVLYFILAVLGLVQYIPVFAANLEN